MMNVMQKMPSSHSTALTWTVLALSWNSATVARDAQTMRTSATTVEEEVIGQETAEAQGVAAEAGATVIVTVIVDVMGGVMGADATFATSTDI